MWSTLTTGLGKIVSASVYLGAFGCNDAAVAEQFTLDCTGSKYSDSSSDGDETVQFRETVTIDLANLIYKIQPDGSAKKIYEINQIDITLIWVRTEKIDITWKINRTNGNYRYSYFQEIGEYSYTTEERDGQCKETNLQPIEQLF